LNRLREKTLREVDVCLVELDAAKQRYALAIERLSHLQALLDLELTRLAIVPDGVSMAVDRGPAPPQRLAAAPTIDRQAVDVAAQILGERTAPMHYRDLYTEIERRGVLIKGASPANTLLTRMLRDGRFKPAGPRGSYVLDSNSEHRHFKPARRTEK
jgi:hypothetical protein